MYTETLPSLAGSNYRSVQGVKQSLLQLFDRLLFNVPLVSEFTNQYLHKNFQLMRAWHFISRAEVSGDYLEFGVFRGDTFVNAMRAFSRIYSKSPVAMDKPKFCAFDSFQGLPPSGESIEGRKFYQAGEFTSSQQFFERRVRGWRSEYSIHVVPGWFNHSLSSSLREELKITRASFINIDCDLYESTVPVLEFITPILQTGTVLYFDDWFSIRGSLRHGEAKACEEWLAKNPHLRLVDFGFSGITGKYFIVNRLDVS